MFFCNSEFCAHALIRQTIPILYQLLIDIVVLCPKCIVCDLPQHTFPVKGKLHFVLLFNVISQSWIRTKHLMSNLSMILSVIKAWSLFKHWGSFSNCLDFSFAKIKHLIEYSFSLAEIPRFPKWQALRTQIRYSRYFETGWANICYTYCYPEKFSSLVSCCGLFEIGTTKLHCCSTTCPCKEPSVLSHTGIHGTYVKLW